MHRHGDRSGERVRHFACVQPAQQLAGFCPQVEHWGSWCSGVVVWPGGPGEALKGERPLARVDGAGELEIVLRQLPPNAVRRKGQGDLLVADIDVRMVIQ